MKYQLFQTKGPLVPGGFEFHDRITNIRYSDTHTFFDERVAQIVRDRLANRRLYTDENLGTKSQVAVELGEYTCARLGNDPRWCTDGQPGKPKAAVAPASFRGQAAPRECPNCKSAKLIPKQCPTCTTIRITGYTCSVCNHFFSV